MKKKKDINPDIINQEDKEVFWKVNTPALITEIGNHNSQMGFLRAGLMIFKKILYELGECSARINDDELNGLMCRLAIYEISDPYSGAYDKSILDKTMKKYEVARAKNRK